MHLATRAGRFGGGEFPWAARLLAAVVQMDQLLVANKKVPNIHVSLAWSRTARSVGGKGRRGGGLA